MRFFLSTAWLALVLLMGQTPVVFAADGDYEAQKTVGAAYPGQLGLPAPAATIKVAVDKFHDLLLMVIIGITAVIFLLLGIVIVCFRKAVHPLASTRTQNAPLEILWTLVPVLIVLGLAFPSSRLIYYMDKARNPEMTVKIIGHQWYWGYEFPAQTASFAPDTPIAIDEYASTYIPDADIRPAAGQKRLLSVDQPLVVPVDTEIQFLITGSDVIHSWYVPSIGINKAAIPGRTNEAWAKMMREGVFYGQCTTICGLNHAYMPIEMRVVSKEKFLAWAAAAKADGVGKANAAILGLTSAANDNPGHIALAAAQAGIGR